MSKVVYLLLFTTVLTLETCALRRESFESTDCHHLLKNYLKDAWGYDDQTGLYIEGDGALAISEGERRECLRQMNSFEIESLFGKPTHIDGNRWIYCKTPECYISRSNFTRNMMIIDFNEKGDFLGIVFLSG